MIYLSALLGSVIFILVRLKMEKSKHDIQPRYKFKFKSYLLKEWDDWAISVGCGLFLTFLQEQIFFGYVEWKELNFDKYSDLYFEIDHLIAASSGLFGSLLIMILFKYVIRKANKLAE